MGLCPGSAHASAKLQLSKDGKTLTLTSHLYFYGADANETIAKDCANEINLYWNGGTHLDSVIRPVSAQALGAKEEFQMQVSGEVISPDLAKKLLASHPSPEFNFIQILKGKPGVDHSFMNRICGNSGTWYLSDELGTSTTAAHEFGHGICLKHPFTADMRGRGAPRMMVPKNSLVDAQFQIDPHARAGKAGGVLNPLLRRVFQSDVDEIDWEDLRFDANGVSSLGGDAPELYPERVY